MLEGAGRGSRAVACLALAALLVACMPVGRAARADNGRWPFQHRVDLTHTLDADVPFIPIPGLTFPFASEPIATLEQNGVAANKWSMHEHLGTQIDAPNHFIENGRSLDEIRPDEFTAPLAVIDIRAKAASDPDAVLTVEDVLAWEKRHGRLPPGACVIMNSGWGKYVSDAKRYIGLDADGVKHFPGIARQTVEFLTRQRDVWGVGVDVVSIDPGVDDTYQTHKVLLSADKLALEAVANLDKVPPSGAMLIIGATKVRGATGGPVRLIAVW